MEGRERTGQVVQALVGHQEDLGVYSEGGRSHGGLWAEEEPALTQVLTGDPWLLQKGQTGGDECRHRGDQGRGDSTDPGQGEWGWTRRGWRRGYILEGFCRRVGWILPSGWLQGRVEMSQERLPGLSPERR